jgi:hypothetical protein
MMAAPHYSSWKSDRQPTSGEGKGKRGTEIKTRVADLSFFIDKECGTGYGPLTEPLFTFCMQLQSPCLEGLSHAASWQLLMPGERYSLEIYINYP